MYFGFDKQGSLPVVYKQTFETRINFIFLFKKKQPYHAKYFDPVATLTFLENVKENNNREWFNANKDQYQAAFENVKAFASELENVMNLHDKIEKVKVFRIYRDVRFSKDKTPYKNSLSGSLSRATKWLRGGYYFHIEPNNSFMAAGFWNPNANDLSRMRQEIAASPDEQRTIIASDTFQKYFGEMVGNKVKLRTKRAALGAMKPLICYAISSF